MMKIGLGLDSHRIELRTKNLELRTNKTLILGGVEVSKGFYAVADSDGDVIIHSLCNALSTAIAGGSLDTWAGPMFREGITDSKEFLKKILLKVARAGYKINNVAIMIEGKQPKLEPYRTKIQQSLAKLLKINNNDIGLAFTTGQDLTSFGKGEGLQALTTVLLIKK